MELKYSSHTGHWFRSPFNFLLGMPFPVSGKRKTEAFSSSARGNLTLTVFFVKIRIGIDSHVRPRYSVVPLVRVRDSSQASSSDRLYLTDFPTLINGMV